jgi:hypothetical protein
VGMKDTLTRLNTSIIIWATGHKVHWVRLFDRRGQDIGIKYDRMVLVKDI